MTSTVFTSGTVITSPWLNDVNTSTYTTVPNNTSNIATLNSSTGSASVGYTPAGTGAVATTVQAQLDNIGAINSNAWGVIKQNISDYATLGSNLLPAFASLTKVNFDGSGNHTAGTVGTITGSVTGATYSYYVLKLVITTTTSGNIALLQSGTTIFGDAASYYFSSNAILNNGTESNQPVTTTDYYFCVNTSSTGFTNISIQTDTTWAGQITALELNLVTQTKFAVGGAGSETNGPKNPVGLKVGALNRNDTAVGNIYTLGMMQDNGVTPTAAQNLALGSYALATNFKGDENTAAGTFALMYNEGSDNTAFGYSALKLNTKGQENTSFGYKTGATNTTGYKNTYLGFWAGNGIKTGYSNVCIGWRGNIAGGDLIATTYVGARAGNAILNGTGNVAVGADSMLTAVGQSTLSFDYATAIGYSAKPWGTGAISIGSQSRVGTETVFVPSGIAIGNLAVATGDTYSIAFGYSSSTTGSRGVAIGHDSKSLGLQTVSLGALTEANNDYNTSIGAQAGRGWTGGSANTFLGRLAGGNVAVAYLNCTLLGSNTAVTGSNQVQLGDSSTTTYAYGAVQNRSDARDKADVQSTVLGLDFINALRPVDFKWDYRESYREVDVDGNVTEHSKDGSKKRNRFHHGLIAQEVKAACESIGVDFGGYQDHSIKDGQDVLSIGYEELIAPLIKAVQQLSAEIAELKARNG